MRKHPFPSFGSNIAVSFHIHGGNETKQNAGLDIVTYQWNIAIWRNSHIHRKKKNHIPGFRTITENKNHQLLIQTSQGFASLDSTLCEEPHNGPANQSATHTIKIISHTKKYLYNLHVMMFEGFVRTHFYLTACVFNTDIFGPARCYFSANIYKLICWRQFLKTLCQWPSPAPIEVNWKIPTDLNRKQLRRSGLDSELLELTEMPQVEDTALGAKWVSPGGEHHIRNNRRVSINKYIKTGCHVISSLAAPA